ncbi:MAG TPA: Lrp/AsnC family transcriptional regulator [Steroidobacteraceae bacterium]|nr:Lrp/AsnC family transcriptional regulator [Steroidobacteraceae bacterium]
MKNATRLDDIDRQILEELSRDGRLSNSDLARRVGLSASACWTRVQALETSQVIQGYTAIVDRASLGLPETIVVEVTLEKHSSDAIESFGKAIERLPEVIDAAVVAGDFDFHLQVAAASTADYEHFLREKLRCIPNVRRVRSIFLLRQIKRAPAARRPAEREPPARRDRKPGAGAA